MKPVMQSKLYQPDAPMRGNCLNACLASLLELPLWMLPAFEDMRADLERNRRDTWLGRLFGLRMVRTEGHDAAVAPHYVAVGPSPRGADIHHAVIYAAGLLVHDPHPTGAGLAEVEWTWHLHEMTDAEALEMLGRRK